jgi:signal transduction histidine kinase
MSETTVFVVALLQLLPAVAWAIAARAAWRHRVGRSGLPDLMALAVMASLLTGYFLLQVVFTLVPGPLHDAPPRWLMASYMAGDILAYLVLAVFRHSARALRRPGAARGAWLVWNYGLAAVMSALAVIGPAIMPFATADVRLRVYSGGVTLYSLVQTALGVRDMAYAVRPGRGLQTGAGVTVTRPADVVFLAGVVALLVAMVGLHVTGSWHAHPVALRAVVTMMGLLIVMPVASRNLGEMLRALVTTTAMAAAVAAIYFGVETWVLPSVAPPSQMRVRMVAVFLLVALLGPGQRSLRTAVDALLRGRGRRKVETLVEFLQGLEPERGVQACCDDAVAALVRLGGARGAAIVLTDGVGAAAGSVALPPLRAAWPGADMLAGRADRIIPWPQFAALPPAALQALVEQDVAVVLPIVGSRRAWGHLFVVRGVLAVVEEGDSEAATAITGQLALVLDVAALLARTVAVERSLAHAEKLAAIGETAARIAHEIRNPVTAARSLAQQLAREPGGSHAPELGLILEELERVERQVASLLRFARREELRVDTLDLSDLVRSTVAGYDGRFEQARVALAVDVADGVTARADRERVRQVLVNLLENALDALADVAEPRRLAVGLVTRNGTATIQVSDNGPGVDESALARLFEPFFSLKATGTGLGLAIARRTVESHGGRIAARRAAEGGLAVVVDLPLGTA